MVLLYRHNPQPATGGSCMICSPSALCTILPALCCTNLCKLAWRKALYHTVTELHGMLVNSISDAECQENAHTTMKSDATAQCIS